MSLPTDKRALANRIKQAIDDLNAKCIEAAKQGLIVEIDRAAFDVIGGNPVTHLSAKIMERIG